MLILTKIKLSLVRPNLHTSAHKQSPFSFEKKYIYISGWATVMGGLDNCIGSLYRVRLLYWVGPNGPAHLMTQIFFLKLPGGFPMPDAVERPATVVPSHR